MKAVMLYGTCTPQELRISEVAVPEVKPGWVLIKVKAFGLNHAELVLRKQEAAAPYIQHPIIPGIECVGEIMDSSDSVFRTGDRVVALMGGMGRSFHGSYAELALLPVSHVFIANTELEWTKMAAVPETFFTAYGSLIDCLQLVKDDVLLIHGATSALGLTAIQLGKTIGCTVIGTTRKKERFELLKKVGADYAVLDDATLTEQIFGIMPHGITKVLELVGEAAVPLTSKLLKKHGIICVTGQLGDNSRQGFDVIKNIPNGVYLSSFYSNYPTQERMDEIFGIIKKNQIEPVIGQILPFDEITVAHEMMEENKANGKIVIQVE
jgi:NADPH:quinone reductase-like Zn-dependent oxidoreductase